MKKSLVYLPAFLAGSWSYILKIGIAEFSISEFYERSGSIVYFDSDMRYQTVKYFTNYQN